MAEPTLGQVLAEFAVTSYQHGVPAEVRTSVRQRVLDTVGIAVAASGLDTSRAVLGYVTEQGGRPQAHAVGVPTLLPAPLAALANGTLAHSLDYDDTHLPSVLHPSASVVPAGLAATAAGALIVTGAAGLRHRLISRATTLCAPTVTFGKLPLAWKAPPSSEN